MKRMLLLGGLAIVGTQAAQAVDMQAGEWTVSVGGIANAYYIGELLGRRGRRYCTGEPWVGMRR